MLGLEHSFIRITEVERLDNEEEYKKELYNPPGIKLRKEYFPGFGKEELVPTVISAFVFLIIDAVLWMMGNHNMVILVFIPLIGVTTVAFVQIKGELNLSMVDIIKLELEFVKSQKIFPYIAKNEWENIE